MSDPASARGDAPAAWHADPSSRLVEAFAAAGARMQGLGICNPTLEVAAIEFAPWEGRWLGVMLTPWFMNLVLTPGDPAAWHDLPAGEKRRYRFPAGDYEFIAAHDVLAGEYQMCSLFSPVLEFDDQATAVFVGRLAREALFDTANAEVPEMPVADLSASRGPDGPGPLAQIEESLDAPMSKRSFLRGGRPGTSDVDRG